MLVPAPRTPPVPGPSKPGDMYTDRATRTIWLGVDPADDPNGMVLISDYEATLTLIEDTDTAVRADTTAALALKANITSPTFLGNPKAPTPDVGDDSESIATTEFVKEALGTGAANQWVTGMIVLWSGTLGEIGIGPLAGWWICDGTHGTPDLRDRFIMGAGLGARVPGTANVPSTALVANTNSAGQHTHTINGHAIDISQMPQHTHGPGSFSVGGTTSNDTGSHTHSTYADNSYYTVNAGVSQAVPKYLANTPTGSESANHTHPFSGTVNGGTSAYVGGSLTHTHTAVDGGAHTHTVNSLELREVVPYYALAYIMKLPPPTP